MSVFPEFDSRKHVLSIGGYRGGKTQATLDDLRIWFHLHPGERIALVLPDKKAENGVRIVNVGHFEEAEHVLRGGYL